MKTVTSKLGSCLTVLVAAIGLSACGRGATVVAKTPAGGGAYGDGPHDAAPMAESAAPSSMSARSSADKAASAPAAPPEAMRSEAPAAGARPGLGTEWGETRYSHVSHTSFDRADPTHPSQLVSLFYNDREGARAMARYADYREMGDAVVDVPGLGIHVALNDDGGHPLPAFFAGGRTYAIAKRATTSPRSASVRYATPTRRAPAAIATSGWWAWPSSRRAAHGRGRGPIARSNVVRAPTRSPGNTLRRPLRAGKRPLGGAAARSRWSAAPLSAIQSPI